MKLAENWERWEVKQLRFEEHREASRAPSAVPSLAAMSHRELSASPPRQKPSPLIYAPIPASKYGPFVSCAAKHGGALRCFSSTPPMHNLTVVAPSYQHAQARPPTVPPQAFTPQPTGSTAPGGRNLHDANEAKANRKSDIERRCQQMNPAISPNILRHMDSFKAAIQISQPMNDYAWSVLQPRLVAQLPAAQQAEAEHVSRVASLPTRTTDRRLQDVNSKEARENMDREWEESQRPIRDRLNSIADEFINQDWDHGAAVTYENSPKFAADLLTFVRRTYYAKGLERDAAGPATPGHQSTVNAAAIPELVLDNLKWVYDNKVKPLTEPYRKEIFLCYGNGCESNTRFYGFEGVIQHYGAKHTNTFSVGNVVVAWREAEWPEETPFHPDPLSVKHTYHASTGSNGHIGYQSGHTRAGTSTPHMPPHLPQASPGPYNYASQYNGPFPPPQTPIHGIPGYGYPQAYANPAENYAPHTMGPPGYGPQPGQHSYIPSPAMINHAIVPPPAVTTVPNQSAPEMHPNGSDDLGHSTSSFDRQVSTIIGLTQDIWKRTSGIKDMPNSLRIYVLLHRVIFKFHIEFNHEPNLNHFIDALSNHEMPKALKNAPGLSCKACQVESSHQLAGAFYAKSEERRTYTVLSLLSHFRTQHLSFQQMGPIHGQMAPPDWKEDMIELPSERFISGLIHAPGMDDEKLLIIATVFPNFFPMPLPKIGVIDSHGVASPASSGPKEPADPPATTHTHDDREKKVLTSVQKEPSPPRGTAEEEYDPHRPALAAEVIEHSNSVNRKRSYGHSPPAERRRRYYADQFYVSDTLDSTGYISGANKHARQTSREHFDDGYSRPREYMEYAPSPRVVHAGPSYDEYTGRRTVFREPERFYGPPAEQLVYSHPREGSHGSREYSAYPRHVRYYEEDDTHPDHHYANEPQSREASPRRGQAAADRFLEELVPGQLAAREPAANQVQSQSEAELAAADLVNEDASRGTPSPPSVPVATEAPAQVRPLAPPHSRAPSTVSNGSRYEDFHHNGQLMPAPDTAGFPRRAGPHRRRDRPHDNRMPARFQQRYMSVARDDRGSSMSRSQSRRYEEQRRRIDQQDTPQPGAGPEHEPAYSRDQSVDQPMPDDNFQHPMRRASQYVSVQDRLHQSPPRYRYDEHRGPQTFYVDEYGQRMHHDYEIVRVRGDHRQPRGPYMSHQAPRYEAEHYQYVPYSYDRPQPQRYNSRHEEYVYYEDRERPVPRRPVPEPDSEVFEPSLPKIKVENIPVPMPENV